MEHRLDLSGLEDVPPAEHAARQQRGIEALRSGAVPSIGIPILLAAAALDPFDLIWKVGVITHKKIESQLVERIHSMGFLDMPTPMHFFNLRGSNAFLESQILVILGCPIPNLTEFQEECEAFLYDDPSPLKFIPNNKSASLKMRDEREYEVKTWGFWTPPVSDYYWQKCQAELYQAVHRIRPYLPKDYDRHIFLFTNMPVPGMLVNHVIIDTENNWLAAAVQVVQSRLVEADQVPASEVATAVERTTKSIANNGDEIAILAGAWYYSGTKGQG
ncbi:MAG: hypothetical protein IH965_08095, partial [Gemmatimonadetes bacterium]|nr:hypothetical protein [Gemmatimonadota bacterium]